MILLPKALAVRESSYPPVTGNNTKGSREVTGIGIASVIHHDAIQSTLQKIEWASFDIPSNGPIKK